MDDLYGDLENYNEVNSAEELRNENKDLKLKLEEYATAMGKLQKDYDKLAMEFHNLQMNYSSLLKTARAEVERKTQMITQLNIEKDMMVMQALQNGNKRLIYNRNNFQTRAQTPKTKNSVETVKGKTNNDCKKNQIHKVADVKNERFENSSVSVPSSESTNLLNIVEKVVQKVDACISKGELKENIPQNNPEYNYAPKTPANSIKNRRKSMPAVSLPKFSSDEEIEADNANKQLTRNETQQSDTPEACNIKTILSKISNERFSNKTSETSSVDGRSSLHQEPAKEDCRDRVNTRHDSDRHKTNDRFRETDRFRGTDKLRDTVRRKESDKYREGDKYRETEKSREADKFREGDKHREIDKFRESDRYRSDKFRDNDKYRESARHKDSDKNRESDRNRDIEKYRSKDKYDYSQRHRRHYSPDRPLKRSHREYQDDYHRQEYGRHRLSENPIETHNYHSRGQETWTRHEKYSYDSEKYKPRCEERFVGNYPTCSDHDEPSNKRQKLETETQSHNNKNKRHIEEYGSISLPTQVKEYELLRTSCQSPDAAFSPDSYTDTTHTHTIKEIKNIAVTPLADPRLASKKYILHTDDGKDKLTTTTSKSIIIKPIDKSLWNVESFLVPDALLHKPQQQLNDDHIKEIYMDIDNPDINMLEDIGNKVAAEVPEVPEKDKETIGTRQSNDSNTNAHATKVLFSEKQNQKHTSKQSYKIPKVKQNTRSEHLNVIDETLSKERHSPKQRQSLQRINKQDNTRPTVSVNKLIFESKKADENRATLSDIAMVHNDLELSDENSDNAEFQKREEKASDYKKKSDMKSELEDLANRTKLSFKTNTKENADSNYIDVDDKLKDTDGQKKQKNKKRKTKSKEIELNEDEVVPASDKKARSKKEKEKPNAIKNKFTDLFGESSSLITPEDLGIPATCVPLCEDAQDAVDININEIVSIPPNYANTTKFNTKENNDVSHEGTSQSTNIDDPNTEDRQLAKRIEEQIAGPEINSSTAYQNLNSEAEINKPDVFQTVIISSGLQPQFLSDNNQENGDNRIAGIEVNIQNIGECNPVVMGFKRQNYMQALATSTPHKDLPIPISAECDSKAIDCATNCNDSKSKSVDMIGHSTDQSDTNTQNSQDAPDVRIFVRRRRKGFKRT